MQVPADDILPVVMPGRIREMVTADRWLVQSLLQKNKISLVYGPSNAGKNELRPLDHGLPGDWLAMDGACREANWLSLPYWRESP